jgi:hypothetical protein
MAAVAAVMAAVAAVMAASFFHKTVFKGLDQIISRNQRARSCAPNALPRIYRECPS